MKKIGVILFSLALSVAMLFFGSTAYAEESEARVVAVSESDGEYLLSGFDNGIFGEELGRFHSIGELISILDTEIAYVYFDSVRAGENIFLSSHSLTFSGELYLDGNITVGEDSELYFEDFTLTLSSGEIGVKGGSLTVFSGNIYAHRTAVRVSSMAKSRFSLYDGVVSVSAGSPALVIEEGTADLLGGRIENSSGIGIENFSTLNLGGSVSLYGAPYEIVTSVPIYLGARGSSFSSGARVQYRREFVKGTVTPVFYKSGASSEYMLTLYDGQGTEQPLRYFDTNPSVSESSFTAVYLPFTVSYVVGGELYGRQELLSGEPLAFPDVEARTGYSPSSWFLDEDMTICASRGIPVYEDTVLFADYILDKPTFSLGNLEFTFDGEEHFLEFSSLSHPLSDIGFYSYQWQDEEGNILSSSPSLSLSCVSDSGKYKCKVSFTVGRDYACFETPFVSVLVNKRQVRVPICEGVFYNGRLQYAGLVSTSLYSVGEVCGINVGSYPVRLTLTDSDNYQWQGTDGSSVTVNFEIKRAENLFLEELTIKDLYYGNTPSPLAISLFGSVSYIYSTTPDGNYTREIPTDIGIYYVKAIVEGSSDYYELESSPKLFRIKSEEIISVSLYSPPEKSEYYAFDLFNPDGLSIKVVYSGGNEKIIPSGELSFFYQSDTCLRYSDTAVVVEYLGNRLNIPVTVRRREYSYSLSFSDCEVEYNGRFQSIDYELSSVTGLDGLPLTARVTGGGVSAGEYTVTLTFTTSSKDYLAPPSITRTIRIKPRAVEVIFGECNFIYNGSLQVPTAHYYDVFGARVELSVSGGRSEAQEGCYAKAILEDNNYTLLNGQVQFSIAKADFDLSSVSLDTKSFVYNSALQSVYLTGLPLGLRVIGYVGNSATDVGKYEATVLFDYDKANYNAPDVTTFAWEIIPACYDTSLFDFIDCEVTYDGYMHYPVLVGTMPTGLDGSILGYSFSEGQINRGERVVKISFYTDSKNYIAPDEAYAVVRVVPKGVYVVWSNTLFTYNGYLQLPDATSDECAVAIRGFGVGAGEHTARAVSLSENFYIINSEITYRIEKRSNSFTLSPSVSDIFLSGTPQPYAEAEYGEVVYKYFSDKELTDEVVTFERSGVYYLVCLVAESDNYLELQSHPIPFRAIEVVPVAIEVTLRCDRLYAFDIITAEDFICKVTNNDGSYFFFDSPEVIYENSGSLTATDSSLTFSCFGIVTTLAIEVERIDYDMSGVSWVDTEHIYDGSVKGAMLHGLPEGVSVVEYTYERAINAGVYLLSARLSYDSVNYNPPVLPEATLTINKAPVMPDTVYSEEYDARPRHPVSDNPLYTFSTDIVYVDAGVYEIDVILLDTDNYTLLTDKCLFVIPKRKITVKVSDLTLYLFEEIDGISGEVVEGGILEGDTEVFEYFSYGDVLSARAMNSNYELTVIEGRVDRLNRLSGGYLTVVFILALLILFSAFAFFVLLFRRNGLPKRNYPVSLHEPAPRTEADTSVSDGSVTLERAEAMITDAIAKTLIRKRDISIKTTGRKRGVVNIDTLSEHFSKDERIDINTLKEKGLISKEIGYIRIEGRGRVDKPLKVFANSFSLSAVKMLALSGGEANRVRTSRL